RTVVARTEQLTARGESGTRSRSQVANCSGGVYHPCAESNIENRRLTVGLEIKFSVCHIVRVPNARPADVTPLKFRDLAIFVAALLASFPPHGLNRTGPAPQGGRVTVTVAYTPGRPANAFKPSEALGACVDGH